MKTRFAIRASDSRRSSIWTVWKHTNPAKADVFLAARSLAHVLKISFHESGENRDAFNKDFFVHARGLSGIPPQRERIVWQRATYAEHGVAHLYRLVFPHSELRAWPLEVGLSEDQVSWIPMPPVGNATCVEIVLTRPGLTELELRNFRPATSRPLVHWLLPTGENVLALPQAIDLDASALAAVSEAARRVHEAPETVPTTSASSRMTLTLRPIASVGATFETAFPCTVLTAA